MNLLFNKPNKSYNLNDFISGKSNKLLIVGYSGSGKTTLAKSFAEKYNAEYISLDDFFFSNMQLKKKDPEKYEIQRKQFEEEQLSSNIRKIIEGVGIMRRLDENTLSMPIIVMGTSFFVSTYRGTLRNLKKTTPGKSLISEIFVVLNKNWTKYRNNLKIFTQVLNKRYKFQELQKNNLNSV